MVTAVHPSPSRLETVPFAYEGRRHTIIRLGTTVGPMPRPRCLIDLIPTLIRFILKTALVISTTQPLPTTAFLPAATTPGRRRLLLVRVVTSLSLAAAFS